MTKKRYSVWKYARHARRRGPSWETWDEASKEREKLSDNYRIWRHEEDGTVTDVTDGDEKVWFCIWDKDNGFRTSAALEARSPEPTINLRGRRVVTAVAYIRSATKPTPEEFQAHVLAETGIEVPCVEEAGPWCWTTDRGWVFMNGNMVTEFSTPEYKRYGNGVELVRVHGTTANRDEKRDKLLAAARAAGKDES